MKTHDTLGRLIRRVTLESRFWTKVDASGGPEACWEWQASLDSKGYGQVMVNYKPRRAHRVAWELTNGPIPEKLLACHKCDNRKCVNPDHLFLGTNADNLHDMDRKGRRVSVPLVGSRHPMAKLNEETVLQIKAALANGEEQLSIARRFECDKGTINHIAKGRQWKHVEAA